MKYDQGLGAVRVGVYPVEDRTANLKQILCLPEPVILLSVVSLGYPVPTPEPAESRYSETRLHHNRW